jgi:DNA helicase-2/ATP-dependent DNA helicase PcrA
MAMNPPKQRKLNEAQQQAVSYGDGPLLIIAGAGTGKTTVITERIAHLIATEKAHPSEILALTFTEKAAREMEARVDMIMPYGYTQMWISTFHKFCDRILRQEAIHMGLSPVYRLMTEADATMLMRDNLFALGLSYFRPLGNPYKFISGLLQHFSRLQDEDISPKDYAAFVQKRKKEEADPDEETALELQKLEELASAYSKYQEIKIKAGMLDFGDLITMTLTLFRQRKNILSQYRKQFKYILVDEFQDTNIAQNDLVSLLAGPDRHITAVCDDDQSIYKFRGAAVSNVLSFRKHFADAAVIVLTENYRSTQSILDSSYALIQHNNPDRLEIREHIDKKLIAARKKTGEGPVLIYRDRVENEAEAVAREIKRLVTDGDGGYSWKDVAILVRANNHGEPFVRALSRHGIPFQFLGPGQLFRQQEIKDLISYLTLLGNIEDSVSMFRVLSMPFFAINARDVAVMTSFAKKHALSLFESAEFFTGARTDDTLAVPFVSDDTKSRVEKIVAMIHRHLGLLAKETAGQILYFFLEDTGILPHVLHYSAPYDETKAANVAKFFNKLKTYETDHQDASVPAVLSWIELSMELGESPLAGDTDWSEHNAVNILTVHSAKGLEFPIVFLVNLVAARFPTIERREQIPLDDALIKEILPEGDYHLEEERRLFYVGMTRARDHLYFSAANYYGEGKREKKLSPFVAEVLGTQGPPQAVETDRQLPLIDWQKTETPVFAVPRQPVTYLSYSQIETFRLCPMHYKLRYILGIPTPTTASLSFGTSVHNAMREWYALHQAKQTVTKENVLALLAKHWIREGYGTKAYETEMKKRGERYLIQYFDTQFKPDAVTVALEQPFIVPVRDGDKRLNIGGKIDRVDLLPDGKIEIIDYKTGKMPTKREVDANLQLSMYAIAASEIKSKPFGAAVKDILLTLYFFDTNERITTTRTVDQLTLEKASIMATAREIETSEFLCSGNHLCASCEYKLFCGSVGDGMKLK